MRSILCGGNGIPAGRSLDDDGDFAVVPLAIPYTAGPGTIGALMEGRYSVKVRITEILGIIFAVGLFGDTFVFGYS